MAVIDCKTSPSTVRALLAVSDPRTNPEQIEDALLHADDHPELIASAGRHRVTPRLAYWVERMQLGARLPTFFVRVLRETREHAITTHSAQLVLLSNLIEAFEAAGIPVMVLKGPPLAELLYEDPSSRISDDIDLVVGIERREAASKLLEQMGYEASWREYYEKHHYHTLWIHRSRATLRAVELHWDVCPPYHPVKFPVPDWWARARPVTYSGGRALTPDAADQAAHLAWHALVSGGACLRDLSEFSLAAAHAPENAVFERADEAGAGCFLAASAQLVERLWGEPIPETWAAHAAAGYRARLGRRLLDAAPLIDDAKSRWWPWSEIACWSLFRPEQAGFGYLLRGSLHQRRQTPWARAEGRPSAPRVVAELALALALASRP